MMRTMAAVALLLTGVVATAAPPIPDEHEKSADSGDKMICKRFIETGSLVRANRVCKTKRDWERDRDELRKVNDNRSCLGDSSSCKW